MKLFDSSVCKPGPNAYTVNDSWKSTVPGYTEDLSPWDNPKIQTVSCDASGNKYVLDPAVVKGTEISSVNAALDTSNDQWVVNITLNGAGVLGLRHADDQPVQQVLLRVPGRQRKTTPCSTRSGSCSTATSRRRRRPTGALTSGSFQITGPAPNGFSQAEATQLQNVLKFGSLPLTFQLQSELYISPQTGHASLSAGLLAGILGLILVVIYLFYYYRGLGIVSVSSLVIAALLAYFSVVLLSKYQNFTMSLSAIAGLVVAIGITADSFIVYFERLRDEVRDGKALRPAVEAGWKRARRTILVSDTVSFLAAVLLYHFATSDVQGFAYTLGLTTIIDVIVVFLFTKPMVTLLAGTKFFSSGSKWSGLDPERLGAKTPWRSGRRTVRSTRTGRPAPAGPGPPALPAAPTAETPQPPPRRHDGGLRRYRREAVPGRGLGQLRPPSADVVHHLRPHPARVRGRAAGEGAELLGRLQGRLDLPVPVQHQPGQPGHRPGRDLGAGEGQRRRRLDRPDRQLAAAQVAVAGHDQGAADHAGQPHGEDRRRAARTRFNIPPAKMTPSFVGPTWGSQITTKALEALIIFLVVIVAYLSIAFEWRMAIAAFVALMHDIVITIGVYALTGFQVSPTTVIGLLTILGYSLYDTVVVFDKVRENTAGLLTSQRSTYSDAANLALNQTLVRSINTSITALIPVASILFIGAGLLGAGTLKDLALVLFVGMLSGTYSSICIATPVLADLKERQPEYKDLAVKVKRRLAGGRRAGQRAGRGVRRGRPVDDNRQRPGRRKAPGRGFRGRHGQTATARTTTPARRRRRDRRRPGRPGRGTPAGTVTRQRPHRRAGSAAAPPAGTGPAGSSEAPSSAPVAPKKRR